MNKEIKEILKDNDELLVRYKNNSFECFDTLPINVLDYITNLEQEKERIKKDNLILIDYQDMEQRLQDYKSRNEKAIQYIKEHSSISGDYTNYWITTESIDLLKILKGDKDE